MKIEIEKMKSKEGAEGETQLLGFQAWWACCPWRCPSLLVLLFGLKDPKGTPRDLNLLGTAQILHIANFRCTGGRMWSHPWQDEAQSLGDSLAVELATASLAPIEERVLAQFLHGRSGP
jgi:hypothetical protein